MMPNGQRSNSCIFSLPGCGAWSVAMASMVPETRPSVTASTSPQPRSGGFILKLESYGWISTSASAKWCGVASRAHRQAPALGKGHHRHRVPGRYVRHMVAGARSVRRAGCRAPPSRLPRPTECRTARASADSKPSCMDPPALRFRSSQWLMTGRSNAFAYSIARRITRAFITGMPSSETATTPAAFMAPIDASSSPGAALGDGADRQDVDDCAACAHARRCSW